MKAVDKKAFGARVALRRAALAMTQAELAEAVGMKQQGIDSIEKGDVARPRLLREIAEALNTTEDWLLWEKGPPPARPPHLMPLTAPTVQNAKVGGPVVLGDTIPLYGQAEGGKDGRFILNGNKIADIIAPPALAGVRDAYAVYVVGDSMEPRYFAGEAVFVNPRVPVRRGDFVVVQIAGDEGEPPYAFVKQFMASGRTLRLRQLNPEKIIEFPTDRVVSVHRIIMSGEG